MENNEIKIIVHACTLSDWLKANDIGIYRADSLISQGFIHCSELETINFVANSHWKGRRDLILLIIDSSKIKAEIKYEADPASGRLYPHVYGPINLDAVIKISDFLPNKEDVFDESSIKL